jgi:hypothetical protein
MNRNAGSWEDCFSLRGKQVCYNCKYWVEYEYAGIMRRGPSRRGACCIDIKKVERNSDDAGCRYYIKKIEEEKNNG